MTKGELLKEEEKAKEYADWFWGASPSAQRAIEQAYLAGLRAGKDTAETDLATIGVKSKIQRSKLRLRKEAEDFLKKSLKVDDDEFDFFKNEASCKEEIKRLTDFIEPREKRIKELEKENAELKGIKDIATLIRANNNTVITLMQLNNMLVSKNQQLNKAKELLTKWVELFKPKGGNILPTPIQVETEQFIREVEK